MFTKKTLSILFTIILVPIYIYIGFLCNANGWMYYFSDITTKIITGVGTIIAGLFVYIKWQDEKTRGLYGKSLQKIYTPLISELIKQETYRNIICPNISTKDAPILSVNVTTIRHKLNFTSDGLKISQEKSEHAGILSKNNFLNVLSKESYGLAAPSLLSCICKYELLLNLEKEYTQTVSNNYPEFKTNEAMYDEAYKSPEFKKLLEINYQLYTTEISLLNEICNGYNSCIKKLEMYDQHIDLIIESCE